MMLELLRRVLGKGCRTVRYPHEAFMPPSASMGRPEVDLDGCDMCGRCASACPSSSLTLIDEGIQLDLSSCIFCGECARICPDHITMGKEFELAAKSRDGLKVVFARG